MSSFKENYKIVPLTGTVVMTGATNVHEVFCLTNGSVTIVAKGGGSMTVSLTAGQSVKVVCSSVTVASGTFVGFGAYTSSGRGDVIRS